VIDKYKKCDIVFIERVISQLQCIELKDTSERVIECWRRIKAKVHSRGDITNIEKHAPCLTTALNQMEELLNNLNRIQIRLNKLERISQE
jgi:hypothetical protein